MSFIDFIENIRLNSIRIQQQRTINCDWMKPMHKHTYTQTHRNSQTHIEQTPIYLYNINRRP